jgi:hypothetical protein
MSEPPNRAQRRHPEKIDDPAAQPPYRPQSSQHDIAKHGEQDEQGVRTKSTGHKKKTADKWNQ